MSYAAVLSIHETTIEWYDFINMVTFVQVLGEWKPNFGVLYHLPDYEEIHDEIFITQLMISCRNTRVVRLVDFTTAGPGYCMPAQPPFMEWGCINKLLYTKCYPPLELNIDFPVEFMQVLGWLVFLDKGIICILDFENMIRLNGIKLSQEEAREYGQDKEGAYLLCCNPNKLYFSVIHSRLRQSYVQKNPGAFKVYWKSHSVWESMPLT